MKRICTVAALVSVLALSACSEFSYPERQAFYAETYTLSPQQVRVAAMEGDGDAQYALGYMYYYGYGVCRNPCEAKYWLDQAGKKGHQEAMQAMELLCKIERRRDQCAIARREFCQIRHRVECQPQRLYCVGPVGPVGPVGLVGHVGHVGPVVPVGPVGPVVPVRHVEVVKVLEEVGTAPLASEQLFSPGERYLLAKPHNHYTLQLAGSQNVQHLRSIIQSNKIGNNSAVYRTTHLGKHTYVLVYGDYPTQKDAQTAVGRLPQSVQHLKPVVEGMPNVRARIFAGVSKNHPRQAYKHQMASKVNNYRSEKELNMKVKAEAEKESRIAEVSTVKLQQPITEIHDGKGDKETHQLSFGERYLIAKPNNHYTLELSRSAKVEDLRKIIQSNKIGQNTAVYRSHHKGGSVYVLVYGDYASQNAAKASVEHLPADVRKFNPRVQPITSVKESINSHPHTTG